METGNSFGSVWFGNFLRRVPIDTVLPDPKGAEKMKESFVDPEELDEEERFENEEVPITDVAKDLDYASERSGLLEKVRDLEEKLKQERENSELLNKKDISVEQTDSDENKE